MEDVFCENLEWGLKLAVETDRHKRVSMHTGHFPSVTYIRFKLRLGTLTLTLTSILTLILTLTLTLTQETGE